MSESDHTALVATLLPPRETADAAVRTWEAGEAILPLDPGSPRAALDRSLDALRPTHLDFGSGRLELADGEPVAAGTAAVVATSGTTGRPKGVELTLAGLTAGARAYCAGLGATNADRWLGCLPMHHVAGLATIGRGWATGLSWTVHDGFDPDRVGRSPRVERTTLVLVVPVMVRRLLDGGAPLGDFRRVVVGAGALDPAVRTRAEDAGAHVVHTYGMTEAWGGIALDGRPIAGVELALADDDEVLVRGPMVMRGYRRDPQGTAAVLDRGGWLHTGDVGRLDDGVLTITDRKKDLVKTGGVSVGPTAVEHVLAAHPEVADVCVVGVPDAEWGERVVAVVVPVDRGRPPSLEHLRGFAREHLTPAELPREVRYTESIPRSPSGKPLRRALRDRGASG